MVQEPRSQCGAELRLRVGFLALNPAWFRLPPNGAMTLLAKARLGSVRPPNLDSQYRSARNNCQELNACKSEKVAKCTSGCD
jgi:hypothetical protein